MLVLLGFVRDGTVPLLGPPTSSGAFHHGALYYYLLAPAAALSDADPGAVVAAIAAAGVGAVLATWWMARSIAGPVAGLVAGGLMAISAAAIGESTFIWNPNLVSLSSALTLAAAWRAWSSGRMRWYVAAAAAQAVTMQCHVLGAVLLVPLALILVADARRRPPGARVVVLRAGLAGLLGHSRDLRPPPRPRARGRLLRVAGGAGVPGRRRRPERIAPPRAAAGHRPADPVLAAHRPRHGCAPGRPRRIRRQRLDPRLARPLGDGAGAARGPLAGADARLECRGPCDRGRQPGNGRARNCPTTTTTPSSTRWCSSWAASARPLCGEQAGPRCASPRRQRSPHWSPSTSPSGRRRSRPTAAGRRRATPRHGSSGQPAGLKLSWSGCPSSSPTDAYGFPLARAGQHLVPATEPSAAHPSVLVVVCDRLFESVIGAACGSQAEAAAVGSRSVRLILRDRADALPADLDLGLRAALKWRTPAR